MDLVWELNDIRNAIIGDDLNPHYYTNTIYHYTSPKGLEGILFKHGHPTFRFSRFDCLNDKSEGQDVIRIYQECIRHERTKTDIANDYLDLIADLLPAERDYFAVDINNYEQNGKLPSTLIASSFIDTYIFSFSEASDDLAMWNYYVKGNRYEGYNIGIQPELMTEFFSNRTFHQGYKFELQKVIYDTDIKRTLINRLIKYTYEKYTSSQKDSTEKTAVRNFISGFLATLRFYFKSEYFKHEQEVRAVITLPKKEIEEAKNQYNPTIKYRIDNGLMIPFIDFEFDKMQAMVESVTIGPLDMEQSQKEAQCDILRDRLENNYSNVNVFCSNAPVRY